MSVLARIFVLCLIHGFLWSQDQIPIIKHDSGATIIFTGDLNFAQNFEYAMKEGHSMSLPIGEKSAHTI